MKSPVLVIVFFILVGVGLLVFVAANGGAAQSGRDVEDVLAGKTGERRVKLQLQVVHIENDFKPVLFEAVGIVPEGEVARADAPRIRVHYDGDEKIITENYTHVAVEGTWNAKDGVFRASRMSTQCPSHYEEKGKPPPPQP